MTIKQPNCDRHSFQVDRFVRRYQCYSRCCHQPILGDGNRRRLYCYGCQRTIQSFAGSRREAALRSVTVDRERCYIRVHLGGHGIAYARDVPNLVWRDGCYRRVGRSTYKYFVHGSSLVTALGFEQGKHVGGFRTLGQAWSQLARYLGIPV